MENREIKFKIFLKNKKGITFLIFTYAQIFNGEAQDFLKQVYSKYKIIGKSQYTGLKDKNGKEIYEGDWILDNVGRKWVIKYEPKKAAFLFYYRGLSHPQPFSRFIKCQKPLEIIGNIYENPELIKQPNEA